MRGFGTVATGTLTDGRLAVDDALEVMPGGRGVKVRGRAGPRRAHAQAAVAGERVAVNLAGVEVADIVRGQTLVTPGTLPATSVIDVVDHRVALGAAAAGTARACVFTTARQRSSRASRPWARSVDGVAPTIAAGRAGAWRDCGWRRRPP